MEKEINIDDAGFLQNSSDWNEEFASETAQKFNLFLTNDHWEVIKFIRNYYTEHNRVPELRKLLKVFKTSYGNDKSSRKYIYNLFPYGYGQQACRIAGMRQPKKLWLDV